jgi:uncharacterized Tic20 family protein
MVEENQNEVGMSSAPIPPGEPTTEERVAAFVAIFLALQTGFVGPLIVWILRKDRSPFVAFHALQAVYFELAVIVAGILCGLLMLICVGFVLLPALLVGKLIYELIIALKALDGEWAEFWLVGGWARGQQ